MACSARSRQFAQPWIQKPQYSARPRKPRKALCWWEVCRRLPMSQCLLDALVGPSRSASTGDRYLVYGPPLGLNDQAVALRNALA
eukprot:scaffold28808_cov66-Phaeocystis_antarctica.AAC.2